ncbi:MAG: hypothetical protein VXW15_14195, partial [Bdellovibrionota bacterium]|nr:hypothetical protein [Bdellovibrionota bacterium]
KKEELEERDVRPETEKMEIGTGHGIYVVKTAISGHGVTLKDLSSIIEASGGVKIQNWNATQENWMNEAVSLVGDEVVTIFVPSLWLLEGKNEPDLFIKHVRDGKLRISCLQKKGELPYFKLPILSIPSDRGSLILEGMVPLVGQAHYSGIHALFPVNTNIYSMAKTTELDRASKSLDTLYDSLMKKARKLMLHKTKVAVGAKTILHAVTMIEPNPPKNVEMKMGYANNLFALSIKWKTGKNSVLDWSKDIPVWKKICSSTSGSWFNFFPKTSEVEALILYSFAIDGENSVPAIDNAYSLGVDIFTEMRLKGQDKVEEKETTQEILVSTTTEKALPSNFDREVVNLYFEEEEIELDGPVLTETDEREELSLGDEEIEIQP